ncbi:hypothetical protein [Planctomicrobium sp. SH527]|uniref:hypothetical protein n=1 Tax=Planctomicrobium sp. SH527 TaxID=3448123 RepID=UPI003F5BF6AC
MIEISTQKCRQTERIKLLNQANRLESQGESSIFLRQTWVLFALAILGLGIWDNLFLGLNPLRGRIVIVGGILALLILILMVIHNRNDRARSTQSELLKQDADAGVYQLIRVPQILAAWIVTGHPNQTPAYLLKTATDALYLTGEIFSDAIDEYHHRRLEAGIESDFTFSTSIIVEIWPVSEEVRAIELTGPQIEAPTRSISIDELPVELTTTFKIIPADALPPPVA